MPPTHPYVMRAMICIGTLIGATACSSGSTSLVVDVRSDFVPGVEAVEVDIVVETLPGGTVTRRSLGVDDDLIRGVRAAEIGPVPPGSHIIRATLKGRSGEELLSRRVAVEAHGVTGVVIPLTRNCEGVTCPAPGGDATATECQDGLCVPPACGNGSCVAAECTADTECATPASVCAEARCVEGVCLSAARIGACEAGFFCVEGSGCVPLPDASTPDSSTPDSSTPDAAVRDGGGDAGRDSAAPDSGCSGECTPGQTGQGTCGICGARSRRCGSGCRWGAYSACSDDDTRCTGTTNECINDYCWGYRLTEQSALSCIDMARDYDPGSANLGTLAEDVFGRPGATWTKENQQTSCSGSGYADAEGGTLNGAGTDSYIFSYGASTCSNSVFGHWRSRFRIHDTDGSSFLLAGRPEITFRNSSCSSDRRSCSRAASFCPPPTCSGVCTPGEMQTSNCGVCGTHSRSCASDCSWGSYSTCIDADARCSGTTSECINDYCWGYRATGQSLRSCIDMNHDYDPGSASYGTLGEDVFGRPGATWIKQNRETSCSTSTYADAEGGTLNGAGTDSYVFPYGASTCTSGVLGHWRSRFRIGDTDGSTFFLGGTLETTFRNASCSLDRSSCGAAASLCL